MLGNFNSYPFQPQGSHFYYRVTVETVESGDGVVGGLSLMSDAVEKGAGRGRRPSWTGF